MGMRERGKENGMTMRLGSDTGSVNNWLLSGTNGAPVPEVGMGATILMWSDRYPATIVAVGPDAKWVDIQEDSAVRIDSNGMSDCQAYRFEACPGAPVRRFTLRKDGGYILAGESMRGLRLRIGDRSAYHDFSF
jgi:hypothetical protein